MSAISGFINTIRNAVYGEQVRGAIISALEQCYSDVNAPSLQREGFAQAIADAYAGGILDIQTVTQVSAMTNQKIIYRYNGTQAGYQKGLYYYSPLSSSWVLIGSEIHRVNNTDQMTDTNSLYRYTGAQTGMIQNALYCHNGNTWVPIGSGVLTASTVAGMTNTGAIYKYIGTQTGMTQYALYYHNGTDWVPVSPPVITDATLEVQGRPADAKATGDAIDTVQANVETVQENVETVQDNVDALEESTSASLEELESDISDISDSVSDLQETIAENELVTLPKFNIVGDLSLMTIEKNEVSYPYSYEDGTDIRYGQAKMKWQGNSSMSLPKKNYTIKFYNDSECNRKDNVKFFGMGTASKWVLKANYIDPSHSRNTVSYRLWGQVVKSRFHAPPKPILDSHNFGLSDGYPVEVYNNGQYHGLYTLIIPKDDWMLGGDEDDPLFCAIQAGGNPNTGNTAVEFAAKNTDSWDVEIGTFSAEMQTNFINAISFVMDSTDEEFYEGLDDYIDVESALDYYLFAYLIGATDSLAKNLMMVTYDGGLKWYCTYWDLDSTYGMYWNGSQILSYYIQCPNEYNEKRSLLWERIEECFWEELVARYVELRQGVLSTSNILKQFNIFWDSVGDSNYSRDAQKWSRSSTFKTQITTWITRRANVVDRRLSLTPTEVIPCESISLNKASITFNSYNTEKLIATPSPAETTDTVSWSSSNENVATVANGIVVPVGVGSCTIAVTCGVQSASCSVTVTSISLNVTWSETGDKKIAGGVVQDGGDQYVSDMISFDGFVALKTAPTGTNKWHGAVIYDSNETVENQRFDAYNKIVLLLNDKVRFGAYNTITNKDTDMIVPYTGKFYFGSRDLSGGGVVPKAAIAYTSTDGSHNGVYTLPIPVEAGEKYKLTSNVGGGYPALIEMDANGDVISTHYVNSISATETPVVTIQSYTAYIYGYGFTNNSYTIDNIPSNALVITKVND